MTTEMSLGSVQSPLWKTTFFLFVLAKSSRADSVDNAKAAHAALGSLAWVIVLPLGAILMRRLQGPRVWMIHAGVQGLGLALVTAGLGNGVYTAYHEGVLSSYHPVIGIVLFACIWLQAAGGLAAHLLYTRKRQRSILGHVHLWFGRALITLGMINGGLGLLFADDASRGAYIAYGVIAGLSWVCFVANAAFFESERAAERRGEAKSDGVAMPSGQMAEAGKREDQ